ncbi:hypothetical protein ACE41A_13315 [Bacillus cytotoxicus]|uniref:hypothetical protein n=1 Tax=Bacillus cytotoxicus TaxID=580165 RepID=UPI0035CC069E
MKLTKQEQATVIGTFVTLLGQDIVNERIDSKKLEKAIPVFNEMEDNTTPKQRREATISILNKVIDEFLKDKE